MNKKMYNKGDFVFLSDKATDKWPDYKKMFPGPGVAIVVYDPELYEHAYAVKIDEYDPDFESLMPEKAFGFTKSESKKL